MVNKIRRRRWKNVVNGGQEWWSNGMEELVSGERGVSGGSGDWLKGEVVVGWGGEGKGAR